MKKIILFINILFLSICVVNADSNGVWTNAGDIREGTFGSDEGSTFFQFVNPVEFNTNLNEAIKAFSLNNHAIYANSNATGKSAIYGFTENNNSYSGFFEGGEFRINSGNLIVNNGNVGIGLINPTAPLEVEGKILSNYNVLESDSNYTVVNKNYVEKNFATKDYVLENIVDTVVTVNSGSGGNSDTTYIYNCPTINPYTYYVTDNNRQRVARTCGSGCTDQLSISPTCRGPDTSSSWYQYSCTQKTYPCSLIGALVQPSGLVTLEFPNEVVINTHGSISTSETFTFTLPSSFVNNVKLNKISGIIGYDSGWSGGSGYDGSKTRRLYYKVTNGANSATSEVFTSTSINAQDLITADFGGELITNRNLQITFYFSGGDDDEWIHYLAKNFFLKFSGDIGTTTNLESN